MIKNKIDYFTFRTGTPADGAGIAALHTLSWRNSYRGILTDNYLDKEIEQERLDLWEKRLSSLGQERQFLFLAEDRKGFVGFVFVQLDEAAELGAYVDNLHIRSDIQGRGLGRRLFTEAAQWVARQEPGWPIHLWVFENNLKACGFYDRFKGEIVAREIKQMPGGADVWSLCYVWRDIGILLKYLGNH